MTNYKDMYYKLFNKITDIIEELKEVQCQMEEEYMGVEMDDKNIEQIKLENIGIDAINYTLNTQKTDTSI